MHSFRICAGRMVSVFCKMQQGPWGLKLHPGARTSIRFAAGFHLLVDLCRLFKWQSLQLQGSRFDSQGVRIAYYKIVHLECNLS